MEFRKIQINFLIMNASRNSKIIVEGICDMSTILAIKNSRHRDILINGTIMLHRELRLELLNDASMNGEYIVIHIHLC